MTLLRKAPNTKSNTRAAHRGPYARLEIIWQVLLLSIGLDLVLLAFPIGRLSLDVAFSIATLCGLIVLLFIDQRRVHKSLSFLRNSHKTRLSRTSATIPVALVLLFGVVKLAKTGLIALLAPIALMGAAGIVSAFIIIALLSAAIRAIILAHREGIRDREHLLNDAWSHVQRWEDQVIIVFMIPLLAARITSFCGVFMSAPPENGALRAVLVGMGILLLCVVKPQKIFFIGSCPRCKHPVPIATVDLGSCLNCDEQLREKFMQRERR